jgi:hypothetical protein
VVPSTWLSVLFFFLLVAPGALFLLLSRQRRTTVADSAFLEVSRIVLASLGFSGAAFIVLAVVRLIWPEWLPQPRQLLGKDSAAYFRDRYGLVLWTVVIGAGLACLFAWLWHLLLARRQGGATIRSDSAWATVLGRERPPGEAAYARVRLDDGVVYSGRVVGFSTDFEREDRELALSQPMQFGRDGDAELEPVPPRYKWVVIPGDSIKVMSVEYRPEVTVPPAAEQDPGQPATPPAES